MTNWILNNVVYSGAGAGVIIWFLLRIIPNEKLKPMAEALAMVLILPLKGLGATVYGAGVAVTGFGAIRFGKKFWNAIEDFFQNSIGIFYQFFIAKWREHFPVNLIEWYAKKFSEGLDSDNGKEEK